VTPSRQWPRIELLVPIAIDPARHEAILAFGPKRSEEPYTREDLDALAAVASSLALLLEGPTPAPDRESRGFEECHRCGTCYDSGVSQCAQGHAPLTSVNMPRTLAGRYRLDRRLGRGGMGTVYEAVDVALDRRVAVKVVRDEWVHNASAAGRFRREARAVAALTHPNIVTVYDYGVEAGLRAFLVMELLRGTSLRDELRRVGRLGPDRTLAILRGVAAAAEAAHQHRLVHRDLKPENIFLAQAGESGATTQEETVKVLDFGVVKPLLGSDEAADAGGTAVTETGVMVGTVGYISPDQLLGDRPDVSWDIWAMAVLTCESLTGALPFLVGSRESWRRLVLTGRATPVAEHLPGAPRAWQAFFDSALAPERARRPASASEFLRQLEAHLRGGH
jgi:serine/threonine protein kinase